MYIWKGINPQTGAHEIEDVDRNGIFNDNDKTFSNDGVNEGVF
jgi:hypothetical protein